ncbi:MAG: hypothetical protein QF566_01885 [Candidatus Thalassarchaeaceae archaeon]|nr:hypothetical protein [Candidatus Thalassarchaeaceae archaeon]
MMGGERRLKKLRGLLPVMIFVALLISSISLSTTIAQEGKNTPTGPGLDWEIPSSHHLFVNGTSGPTDLNREYPYFTGEPPFVTFGVGSNTVIEVESEPSVETVVLNGEADVYVYASLISDTPSCLLESVAPGLGATSFTVWLDVGTTTIIDGEQSDSIVMQDGWEAPVEFHVNATYDNVTLGENDVISLTIQVNHFCTSTQGRVYWDAYQSATRAILEGEMLQPEMTVSTDANGLARIEFTPISPWGADDYDAQFIDIVGPLGGWEEGQHITTKPAEDSHIEHFEAPHGSRLVEANRSALVWISNASLKPGKYMVDACFILKSGDYNEDCDSENSDHIIAVYRFETPTQSEAVAGSGWFWFISMASLLGYLGLRMKNRLLPWPTLVLLIFLAFATMIPAATLPELERGATRDDSAAPAFSLLQHPSSGSESISLNDLLSGHDALVLGVFTSGSPNAEQQKRDFDNASERLGDKVAFAQIATGTGVQPTDLDYYAQIMNGSWPLLIDESKGEVADQLPTRIADGVIIIDSAGFISSISAGSMSDQRIVESVEKSKTGSDQSMLNLFSLLIPSFIALPLLLLSFPRKRTEVPETALPPGAGLGGTVLAAGVGFAAWSLPIAILSLFTSAFWPFIELLLMAWLGWQGLSLAIHGKVHEIQFIATQIHKRLPDSYQKWRLLPDFSRDVILGHWLAWLSWFAFPLMIPQGIGALASASLTGLILAPLSLIAHCLIAGFVVLLLRSIATIMGPVSRLIGMLGHREAPRLWGCLLIGMALWWVVWLLVGPINNTLFT